MKAALALFALLLGFTVSAVEPNFRFIDTQDSLFGINRNQTEIYRQLSCAQELVSLVQSYFAESAVEVDTLGDILTLDKSSLQFCGIDDQNQGSYNIKRHLTLCAEFVDAAGKSWSGAIYATTEGDMFCERERVLEINGLWVH